MPSLEVAQPVSSGRHTSRSYRGRHAARHAAPSRAPRIGSALLPLGAAAALVTTATGAVLVSGEEASSASITGTEAIALQVEATQASADDSTIAERRSAVSKQTSALVGRDEAAKSASRGSARTAIKAAAQRAILERNGKQWVAPMKGMKPAGSHYGMRLHPVLGYYRMHYGNDYTAAQGTPLMAMSKGKVTFASYFGGAGICVQIEYWDGTVSYYEHMSKTTVKVGQEVLPGDVVGLSGNTGLSTGPHLHLEIHPKGGAAVDPSPWLQARGLPY